MARYVGIVAFASPDRGALQPIKIDHVLPNGKHVVGTVEPPVGGMSPRWLDEFASIDPRQSTRPTDEALTEVHTASRAGRITARGTLVATGERREIGSDEWRWIVIDSPPYAENEFIRYRLNPTRNHRWSPIRIEGRWSDILFPTAKVLALWPPSVNPAPPPAINQASPVKDTPPRSGQRRKPSGVDYTRDDAPLVQEMRRLLDEGKARGVWDAALAVAGRAKGHGRAESKAKRLWARYSAAFGTERGGGD